MLWNNSNQLPGLKVSLSLLCSFRNNASYTISFRFLQIEYKFNNCSGGGLDLKGLHFQYLATTLFCWMKSVEAVRMSQTGFESFSLRYVRMCSKVQNRKPRERPQRTSAVNSNLISLTRIAHIATLYNFYLYFKLGLFYSIYCADNDDSVHDELKQWMLNWNLNNLAW